MFDLNLLNYALSEPLSTGSIKENPDDFRVDELPSFELSGEGEHLFLHIEKKGLNTEELVKSLSRTLKKSQRLISYAGLKDRQAITTQWISVHCPGEDIPDADKLEGVGWRVISANRHNKKLKTGALAGNKFTLILREIDRPDDVERRLECIQTQGVPNYFGSQRFGRNGQNLLKAQQLFFEGLKVNDRFLKGMYYSAARAALFNHILSERVEQQSWNKALSGDVMQLAGTHSIFELDEVDETIRERLSRHDISPTAVLWGRGEDKLKKEALAQQRSALFAFEPWLRALEEHGLSKAYRALILTASHLKHAWQDNSLNLSFELPAGAYATTVLRELVKL